jgi:hypothetical protein
MINSKEKSNLIQMIENMPDEDILTIKRFIKQLQPSKPYMKGSDLLESDLVGLWKDRADIDDSSVYARQLREKIQRCRYFEEKYKCSFTDVIN